MSAHYGPGFLRLNRRRLALAAAAISFVTLSIQELPAYAAPGENRVSIRGGQSLAVGTAAAQPATREGTFGVTVYTPLQWPVDPASPISKPFREGSHHGVDFLPGVGSPVEAIADGVVVESEYSGALGQHVIIQHVVDGHMVQSVYGHMQSENVPVAAGDKVLRGELIGHVGSTGASTGPHLHFGILPDGGDPIEPIAWMKAHVNEPLT